MTMGFKYQLIACSYPQELLHVTLNHLHQLRAMIAEAHAVAELVDEAIRATNERYLNMSAADFASLKQALCRFFEDKRAGWSERPSPTPEDSVRFPGPSEAWA